MTLYKVVPENIYKPNDGDFKIVAVEFVEVEKGRWRVPYNTPHIDYVSCDTVFTLDRLTHVGWCGTPNNAIKDSIKRSGEAVQAAMQLLQERKASFEQLMEFVDKQQEVAQ